MRCAVLLASSVLLTLSALLLIGCGSSSSGSGSNSSTSSQMGSYTVDLTKKLISYTPPTTLSNPVTSVSATLTSTTTGATTPIYAAFTSPQTGTYTLDISSTSPELPPGAIGTYSFVVTAGLQDNTSAIISGTPTSVVLSGGTGSNAGGPPAPPF